MCLRRVIAAAETAVGTRRLGNRGRFAGDAVEDWRSASRRGGDGRREGSEEFGVGLWWRNGCLDVLLFLLDDVESTWQWASW